MTAGGANDDMASPADMALAAEVRGVGGFRAVRSWIASIILSSGGDYSGVPERVLIVGRCDGGQVAEDGVYNSYVTTNRKLELDRELSVKPLAEFLADHEIHPSGAHRHRFASQAAPTSAIVVPERTARPDHDWHFQLGSSSGRLGQVRTAERNEPCR